MSLVLSFIEGGLGKPNAEAIELLSIVTEKTKTGDVQSVIVITEHSDGHIGYGHSVCIGKRNVFALAGATLTALDNFRKYNNI